MAITRRQFVTRLGALAGAAGMSQMDMAKIVESWAHAGTTAWTTKPKVIWVHGAECTGCSTSVLGLLEDARAEAIPGVSIVAALNHIAGGNIISDTDIDNDPLTDDHPSAHRTLANNNLNVENNAYGVNIADVLIDFIDLQYHETVMGMGGDRAFAYLEAARANAGTFVLVVEGALQDHAADKGYWNQPDGAAWCSIAADGTVMADVATHAEEAVMSEVVGDLASQAGCLAVIAVGQCATYGGYPACESPALKSTDFAGGTRKQTGAMGVYEYLDTYAGAAIAGKVVNVPGCPTNPWWFVATAVLALYDITTGVLSGNGAGSVLLSGNGVLNLLGDGSRRPDALFGRLLHGKLCPRYRYYVKREYASNPGEVGCLKNLGCDGLSTMSPCGTRGWNGMQPANAAVTGADPLSPVEDLAGTASDGTPIGGNCLVAGAPCMGCTEPGYPDAFTPFCTR